MWHTLYNLNHYCGIGWNTGRPRSIVLCPENSIKPVHHHRVHLSRLLVVWTAVQGAINTSRSGWWINYHSTENKKLSIAGTALLLQLTHEETTLCSYIAVAYGFVSSNHGLSSGLLRNWCADSEAWITTTEAEKICRIAFGEGKRIASAGMG